MESFTIVKQFPKKNLSHVDSSRQNVGRIFIPMVSVRRPQTGFLQHYVDGCFILQLTVQRWYAIVV